MRLTLLVGRVLAIVAVLGVLYALGWTLTNIGTVGRVMCLACLSAYLLNPIVKRLQNRGMTRSMAIAAVFLGFLTTLTAASYLLLPVAQKQAVQIGEQMKIFTSRSDEHITRLQVVLEEKLPGDFMKNRDVKADLDVIVEDLSQQTVAVVTALLLAVAFNLIYIFLLPMMVFLLLQDGPLFYCQLIKAIPNRYFEIMHRLINRVDDQLGGYMRGVMIVTLCVGTVSTLGLWIVGMEYFFVIGPLMGLLNVIPIFGPLVGMGIGVLAMLFQTGEISSIVGPIIVGVTAQVLDNIAFTPIAVSRSVNLHPLLVLLMTLVGGELIGLVGLLLAVPATATVKVIGQAIQEVRQSKSFSARTPEVVILPQESGHLEAPS